MKKYYLEFIRDIKLLKDAFDSVSRLNKLLFISTFAFLIIIPFTINNSQIFSPHAQETKPSNISAGSEADDSTLIVGPAVVSESETKLDEDSIQAKTDKKFLTGAKVLKVPKGKAKDAIEKLKASGKYKYVEKNIKIKPVGQPMLLTQTTDGTLGSLSLSAPSTSSPIDSAIQFYLSADISNYTGTVHFTSDHPNDSLPPDYTFQLSDNGQKQNLAAAVCCNVGEDHTIKATDIATGISSSFTIHTTAAVGCEADNCRIPNDPLFYFQSYLNAAGNGMDIQALKAWIITTGSKSIVIGGIDTGIDYTHPDLSPNIWSNPGGLLNCPAGTHGFDIVGNDCDPMDDSYNSHGTATAGVMGAVGNNGIGVTGINWNSTLISFKACGGLDSSCFAGDLMAAMDYALKLKQTGVNIRVLNISIGGLGSRFQYFEDEARLLNSAGITVVVAAGNESIDASNFWPCLESAVSSNVICVGASDIRGNLTSYSNYGSVVDLNGLAPTLSTCRLNSCISSYPQPGYSSLAGTSLTTPQVAGAAALILSKNPNLTPADIKARIRASINVVPSLVGKNNTGGILNIYNALTSIVLAPTGSPTPTLPIGSTPTSAPTPKPTVTPADSISPNVSITQPSKGAIVPLGKTIVIASDATDNVKVAKVDFYASGTRKCSVNTQSSGIYNCNFRVSSTSGIVYSIYAKAYDSSGNTAQTNAIVVTSGLDTIPPLVTLTNSLNQSSVTVASILTLEATASDTVGVSKVEFYVGSQRKCSDNASPYSCNWTVPSTSNTTYTLSAKAYDYAGNASTSSVSVTSK